MGKIKSKLIKRTGESLMEKEKGLPFSEDFEKNKKILGDTMPSKKIKNRIAGYLVRLKKAERAAKIEGIDEHPTKSETSENSEDSTK
jgi:ribosomal protein S17E